MLFYVLVEEKGRQKRREVTDLQWQIERLVYIQVAIQTGDAGPIRKLRERVQLKYAKTNAPTDQCPPLSLPLYFSLKLSLTVTYRKSNNERDESQERAAEARHLDILEALQKGIPWIFSSELDAGLNTALRN